MSWLYSIVFAGLLFSSQNGTVTSNTAVNTGTQPSAMKVRGDETERFEQTYPLTANGRVSVSNVNGSIIVEAWDKNEVHLEAVKTADTKERLSQVEIKVDAKADSFSVSADYDNWKNQNNGDRWKSGSKLEVQFHLSVPRGAVLDEVETVNGSVTVADFTNFTKISAVNGNVKATNLRGTANLSTVNGEVAADFDRLETGSKIFLETVNGRVNLSIPSDSSATLRADSVNGVISNDFGLPVRKGQYVGRDLYGKIGSGDVHVKLSSVNGPLAIGRKNDGKNMSPATNLLQQKNKDDEDWDDDSEDNDDDSSVDTAKITKDVERAVKNSTKDAAIAMKHAQKEMVRIKPEIAKINAEAMQKATEAIRSQDIQVQIQNSIQLQADAMIRLRDIGFGSSMPRIEKKSDTIAVKGTPKVTIDAGGCSVKVHGWDKQEVQYTVTQLSDNRNRTPIQMKEDHSDSAVNITVVNLDKDEQKGNFYNDNNRVRIEVFVPKKSNLKITTSGEIRLEGVSGDVELSGGSEAINVRDVDGKMSVTNCDGRVRVIGFHGQLDAKTTSGSIYLEGDFDRINAKASDGTIVLTLPNSANASITSNKEVETEGLQLTQDKENSWRLGKGGSKYDFDLDDGRVIVRSLDEIGSY